MQKIGNLQGPKVGGCLFKTDQGPQGGGYLEFQKLKTQKNPEGFQHNPKKNP